MKKILRTALAFAGVLAAGHFLSGPVRAVAALAFGLAAFAHFGLRALRHRSRGKARASGVSVALAFLSLGPVLVIASRRGFIPASAGELLELGAFLVSVFLAVAILRVEQMDDARTRLLASKAEAARVIRERKEARAPADVREAPTARRG